MKWMKTWLLLGYKSLNTIENSRLRKGYKEKKGKYDLSGVILLVLDVFSAFIQSSDSASTCLVKKSLKVKAWPIWMKWHWLKVQLRAHRLTCVLVRHSISFTDSAKGRSPEVVSLITYSRKSKSSWLVFLNYFWPLLLFKSSHLLLQ